MSRLVTKSGRCMQMCSDDAAGWTREPLQIQPASLRSIRRRSCCVFGGTAAKAFGCFEFMPENETVTAEIYCQQLEHLNDAMSQNRQKILLHDNARLLAHTRVTSENFLLLGWEVLSHTLLTSHPQTSICFEVCRFFFARIVSRQFML